MEHYLLVFPVILSYLIGSIPTSVWVGKLFYGIDIRTRGSGNAGATNTIRVLGLKAGLPVLAFDAFKGWMAVELIYFFPVRLQTENQMALLMILLGTGAVIGHVFPLFAGFRGGKGVATLLGVGLALFPVAALIALTVFILVFIPFRYVSLASIIAAVSFPVIELLLLNHREHWPLMALAVAVAIFIPLTHRRNIGRLLRGTESRLTFRNMKKS